jgi:undecaprenyl-diphosphatase
MDIDFMQTRSLRPEEPRLQRLERVLEWDRACAVVLNRTLTGTYEKLWIVVDQLGDSKPWVAFIIVLALFGGAEGRRCALHMFTAGGCATVLYMLMKRWIARERPCFRLQGVRRCVEPLDQFSFPSGHTLHAVAFSVIAVAYFPAFAFVLVPLTALIAVSRVAIGLHYPSDVVAGAAIGAGVALTSFLFVSAL